MIKRLIFDLDNTIIDWKDDYTLALQETVKEFNINIDYKKIDNIIEQQEYVYETLSKEQLMNDINNICGLELNMEFIETLLEKQKNMAPKNDKKIQDLFSYLSSKYEIVLLTNWFTETQSGRLNTLGIAKYFCEFYGGDKILLKPRKDAFLKAIGSNKKEECIMIGDNLELDIIPAINLGITTIKVDKKSISTDKRYTSINDICQLKDIL